MALPLSNLHLGATVGDYQILAVIGRGGMGKVFKVRNTLSDRIEAMKVLLPDLDPSPDLVERFLREIKVVAALEHPGIASLRTALRIDNQVLMIMECVEGCSLQALLHRGRIEASRAIDFVRQALDALGYAHHRGVVHRDVKPSNILVTPDDRVKLTDFGIASRSGDPKLTAAGIALGSLHYMSPEQMKGEPTDARSDLYSVGVTLFEMITGQPPVLGNSFYAILRAHLEEKPRPALELAPEIGPELSGIIDKSLEKNPEARFQSAEEFQAELSRIPFAAASQPAATSMFQARPRSETPVPKNLTPPPYTPAPLQSTPPAATPKSDTGSKSWDPAILENARKQLAEYVGPMAKVLVSRAARTARTPEELYRALAAEISAPSDREKFLRSQHL
jgi:eukaryotic-like serine/threonine-protein kinase